MYEQDIIFSNNTDKRLVHQHGVTEVAQLTDGQPTSIWAGGLFIAGQKPLPSSDGETLYVYSSSADDADGGTGAQTIEITGQDPQGLEQSEIVTLNGQTGVATTKTYRRSCFAQVKEGEQVGNIYIGDDSIDPTDVAAGGELFSMIPVTGFSAANNFAKGVTQQACFSIPAGYSGYIEHYYFDREQGSADTVAYIRYRLPGETQWKVLETKNITSGPTEGSNPTLFPALTDIDMCAVVDSSTEEVSGDITVYLQRVEDVAAAMNGSLTISDIVDDGFTVTWQEVENTNFSEGYRIDVIDETTSKLVKSLSTQDLSITIIGLIDGRDYTVKVYNKFGSAYSTPLESTGISVGLAVPTSFDASPGDGQLSLSWDAVSNADSYEIEKTGFGIISDTASPYVDTDVVNGTEYEYRIRAVKGDDRSDWSTPITGTPVLAVIP